MKNVLIIIWEFMSEYNIQSLLIAIAVSIILTLYVIVPFAENIIS